MNSKFATLALSFWSRIKYLFIDPVYFFSELKKEKSLRDSLSAFALLALVLSVVKHFTFDPQDLIFALRLSISSFISIILFSFIAFGIFHVLLVLLKGKGNYIDTYNICAYSLMPFFVVMFVLNARANLFYLLFLGHFSYLAGVGFSTIHQVPKKWAFLISFLPFVLAVLTISLTLFVAFNIPPA